MIYSYLFFTDSRCDLILPLLLILIPRYVYSCYILIPSTSFSNILSWFFINNIADFLAFICKLYYPLTILNYFSNISNFKWFIFITKSSAYILCQISNLHILLSSSIKSSMYMSNKAGIIGDPWWTPFLKWIFFP